MCSSDLGLRVSESAHPLARVLVRADVVHDVRDAVLHELPFDGFTGLASGLSKQLCDGLVRVHGVLSGYRKGPPPFVRLRAVLFV